MEDICFSNQCFNKEITSPIPSSGYAFSNLRISVNYISIVIIEMHLGVRTDFTWFCDRHLMRFLQLCRTVQM